MFTLFIFAFSRPQKYETAKWGEQSEKQIKKGVTVAEGFYLFDIQRRYYGVTQRKTYRAVSCFRGVLSVPRCLFLQTPCQLSRRGHKTVWKSLCSTSPTFPCPLKSSSVKPTSPLPRTDWPLGPQPSGRGWRRKLSWHCTRWCVRVCVQEDQFPTCRHHVPFDRSRDWSFETYLAPVIFQNGHAGASQERSGHLLIV